MMRFSPAFAAVSFMRKCVSCFRAANEFTILQRPRSHFSVRTSARANCALLPACPGASTRFCICMPQLAAASTDMQQAAMVCINASGTHGAARIGFAAFPYSVYALGMKDVQVITV